MRKYVACIAILLLAIATPSQALVMRHDLPQDAFIVPESEFDFVFPLLDDNGRRGCAATLISERWALTAAHCVVLLRARIAQGQLWQVQIAGSTYGVDAMHAHPNFGRMELTLDESGQVSGIIEADIDLNFDIALIRLDRPVSGVTPVALATPTVGIEITIPGWGAISDGRIGVRRNQATYEDVLRVVTNRVDRLPDRFISFDFDRPASPDVTRLEGVPGPGDSGGPALSRLDGAWGLVGVSSHGRYPGLQTLITRSEGRYGWREFFVRPDLHLDWIRLLISAEN